VGDLQAVAQLGRYGHMNNKNNYHREINITDQYYIYNLISSPEYLSAGFFKRLTKNDSKYIGELICLNSPPEDGTNPHWRILLEILSDENKNQIFSKKLLYELVELLEKEGLINRPVWIEGREFISREGFALGDLWNDD